MGVTFKDSTILLSQSVPDFTTCRLAVDGFSSGRVSITEMIHRDIDSRI